MPNSQTNCNPVKNVFNLQGQKQERILLLLGKLIENRLKIVAQTKLEVENYFINQDGTLVFYHQIVAGQIRVYSLLLETAQLNHLLWKKPRLIFDIGQKKDLWQFKKLKKTRRGFVATWNSKLLGKKSAVYPYYLIKKEVKLKQQALKLIKHQNNPMLSPQKENDWEAFCTFNPAAIYAADKVHLLYRAQGYNYVSKIGYASSSDGFTVNKRLKNPVYYPSQKFEGVSLPLGDPNNPFVSGGGCGGCEDPRATIIDDRVYLTYVAYDGWNPPRVALSSIALKDFLNHNFLWEKPVLISQPGIVDKSAVIFPEKINGKYVIMHRVFPNILIDFVDSLDFDGQSYLLGEKHIPPRSPEWWDSRKIGAGAPPLKTDEGWLLIYQAVDDKDASEYKVGAMLLDLEDPSQVLYRSSQPILEPRQSYENNGFKAGIVYPCGAVIKDDTLFVYYGGSDSYVCVATAPLQEFLENLKQTGITHLESSLLGVN